MKRIDFILLIFITIIEILVLFVAPVQTKKISLYLYAAYYVSWSMIVHAREKTLSTKIVLEYFLLAAIAVVALQVLLITSL
ncbi:hypothetical protein COU88_04180 [Candidatus Roizmanbacteria bacterium CG10_big_fil_rev_8_21_14_0_10_39_6]|uniref:Uncharacterized protein n=1 Tax=Candidatus Roizmanbacteria bacterium CG10_big_fil_rev_8_21_14_0_10_39_6 TaxID=1974853 RepID=A0A2M8KRR7_9BACT|nr:MAG: hypothetical protein COU88_04180 [Candidatus Roizmanbacteria bacterium CG10_big_fil_rev_8_21_14_0_10_39_6]